MPTQTPPPTPVEDTGPGSADGVTGATPPTVHSAYRALGAALGYAPYAPAAPAPAPAGSPAWEDQAARLEVAAALLRHLGELPTPVAVDAPATFPQITLFPDRVAAALGYQAAARSQDAVLDTVLAVAAALGVGAAHDTVLASDGSGRFMVYLGNGWEGPRWRDVEIRMSVGLDDPDAIARAISGTDPRPAMEAVLAARAARRVDAGLAGGAQ